METFGDDDYIVVALRQPGMQFIRSCDRVKPAGARQRTVDYFARLNQAPVRHPAKLSLTSRAILFILFTRLFTSAEVVELVDALRSGRSGSNPVGVRVPPSAP